jgi:anti-sigma-K factor RskA
MAPGCEHGIDVGTYVLGAMPDDEHERFAAHLPECPDCREEVARLQVAADAVALSTPVVGPPPQLRDRIMSVVRAEAELLRAAGAGADRVRAERRARRLRLPASLLRPLPLATLACALAALALGIAALVGSGGGSVRMVTAAVHFADAPRAKAMLRLASGGASLEIQGAPAPGPGKVYEVWLQRAGGAPEPTSALFTVGASGNASVNVPGDLEGVRRVMVTAEPAGGSVRPTGAVVIVASPT